MSDSKTIYLKDYKKPDYLIPNIHLDIYLDDTNTRVTSTLTLVKNTKGITDIVLNGENQTLLSVKKDSILLSPSDYTLSDTHLRIPNISDHTTLEIESTLNPSENLALEGIYKSDNIICSQNEPEGFRRITYFIDRPDVLSSFTTKLSGNKKQYPLLLSNGNPIERGDIDADTHFVTWEDPFPKACYLFAVVAGDLAKISDTFTTKSGRDILLEIYTDKGQEDRCWHAMTSLKKSMTWDEDIFGLEYDLDIFMIVAVDAFNMGAMENKGLNIFNAAYILADPKTATDSDYKNIEAVVAHEYFHNWTGNRVTCRDWFQLTLKEGLTVFRDQEFSSDMNVRSIERIENIRRLRNAQFPEDAGPMTHPIRPESYEEVNNFYTATVYEKGAEIIRMIHTIIGKDAFRKGIDIYFDTFDGMAVTTEDFIDSMEKASGYNFDTFKYWYHQAGTPTVSVTEDYNAETSTYSLHFSQHTPKTPETTDKKPFTFPIVVGLLDSRGKSLGEKTEIMSTQTHTLHFSNIKTKPIPSLFRELCAPVIVQFDYSDEDLSLLMTHDENPVNQYEAAQNLALNVLRPAIVSLQKKQAIHVPAQFLNTIGLCIDNPNINLALKAEMLTLPSVVSLVEGMEIVDYHSAIKARKYICQSIAKTHAPLFIKWIHTLSEQSFTISPESMAQRRFKNLCLSYLAETGDEYLKDIYQHYKKSTNMTDQISALAILCQHPSTETKSALRHFHSTWKHNALIMNKWISVQASSPAETTFKNIQALEHHPIFDKKNPNKCRALYGAFASNHTHFHAEDGSGYRFLAEKIADIDTYNPSIAARLSTAFKKYKKLDNTRQATMKGAILSILDKPDLSKNTQEILTKTLA
jgi:aminopeptidase N